MIQMPSRPNSSLLPAMLLGALLCAAITGCATHAPRPQPAPHPQSLPPSAGPVERTLRAAAHAWWGTPYRLGGMNREGIDCSGLVVRIFRDNFDLDLPRTTKTQVKAGTQIARDQLQPGDLVFFRRRTGKRHVGIYLGRREFVHSSGRYGVTISHLDTDYWQDVYWTARRVL